MNSTYCVSSGRAIIVVVVCRIPRRFSANDETKNHIFYPHICVHDYPAKYSANIPKWQRGPSDQPPPKWSCVSLLCFAPPTDENPLFCPEGTTKISRNLFIFSVFEVNLFNGGFGGKKNFRQAVYVYHNNDYSFIINVSRTYRL